MTAITSATMVLNGPRSMNDALTVAPVRTIRMPNTVK